MAVLRPDPAIPPDLSHAEKLAIKALMSGVANEGQQKLAAFAIVHKISGAEESTFFPGGIEGQRLSDFAAGKAFVGKVMLGIHRATLAETGEKPNASRSRSRYPRPEWPGEGQSPAGPAEG